MKSGCSRWHLSSLSTRRRSTSSGAFSRSPGRPRLVGRHLLHLDDGEAADVVIGDSRAGPQGHLGEPAVAFGGPAYNASSTAGLRHVPRLLGLALEGTWTTPCHVALPQIPQPFDKSGHLTHLLQCEVALERGQSWCAETGWMAQLMP
jgi:hypothetical protein